MVIDLSKLNELGGGAPKSEAIRPKANVRIEKQQELERERERFLKEQRERVANTSALKLEIIKAINNKRFIRIGEHFFVNAKSNDKNNPT